jgi:hypothetical protein
LKGSQSQLTAGQSQLANFESRPGPLPGFQKLFANSKAFRANWQRLYYFNIKLKGQLTSF